MAEPIDSTFWEFAYDIVTSDSLRDSLLFAVAAATTTKSARKKRKKEEVPRMPRNVNEYPNGDIRLWRLDPAASPWWQLINKPGVDDVGTRAYNAFRRKFRVPLVEVKKLVDAAQLVKEWADKETGRGQGRGPSRHPLILKVLAALRCLGKGCDPESQEDGAHISASTLKVFVPAFVRWLADDVFKQSVVLPEGQDLQDSLEVFSKLGFPGAYCNTDGVHISWATCSAKLRALFTGKEHYPTVAFNVSVLQNRQIIYVSPWAPGSKNDKTQAAGDELFRKLRTGQIHPEETYVLYAADGSCITRKGLYALVDGGYHQWRCLQAPLTCASSEEAARWSERVESVRKAVECTFGILKKRFRILRQAMECLEAETISDTFKACCALHNILLRHDGLHSIGRDRSDWVPAKRVLARCEVEGERAKHTCRGPRNMSGTASQREPGHNTLREELIAHYAVLCKLAEAGWLRPASQVRVRLSFVHAEEGAGLDEEEEDAFADDEDDLVSPDEESDQDEYCI